MSKYISTTYLKDIYKYIYYQYTKKDIHIVIKKILDTKPYIINEDGVDIKILDNNYYIVEVIPMNKNYICRIHIDNHKNIIERYYTMTLNNKFINNIPIIKDLKTSYVCCDFQKKVYNIEYLEGLYKDNKIKIEDYTLIRKELQILIDEINNGTNEIYNLDYINIIERCEEI